MAAPSEVAAGGVKPTQKVLAVPPMSRRKGFFFGLLLLGCIAIFHYMYRLTTQSLLTDDLIERSRLIIPLDPDLEKIPAELVQRWKCPACLGQSLCEDIDQGTIKMRPQAISDVGFRRGSTFYGKYEDMEVTIKTLAPQEDWAKFDKFICQNVTQSAVCDVSSAILKSYMTNPDLAITVSHLKEANNILHDKRDGLPFTMCLTSDILEVVKDVNSIGVNDVKEKEKTAELYTSTIVNQEAMLGMYLKVSETLWYLPSLEGSCGRLLIYKHRGKPLRNFLNGTFLERVDLSLQILQLVDSFAYSDGDLVVAVTDFSFDRFAVDEEGALRYTDMSELMVLDRKAIKEEETNITCNEDCFQEIRKGLLSKSEKTQKSSCSRMSAFAPNMMYSLACKTLLSDLKTHRFNRNHNLRGLLHSLDSYHRNKLLKAHLMECVQETKPGGRLHAVEEINTILQGYELGEL